jgi:hypothetical protein
LVYYILLHPIFWTQNMILLVFQNAASKSIET